MANFFSNLFNKKTNVAQDVVQFTVGLGAVYEVQFTEVQGQTVEELLIERDDIREELGLKDVEISSATLDGKVISLSDLVVPGKSYTIYVTATKLA
jgi:hypothetical protein